MFLRNGETNWKTLMPLLSICELIHKFSANDNYTAFFTATNNKFVVKNLLMIRWYIFLQRDNYLFI